MSAYLVNQIKPLQKPERSIRRSLVTDKLHDLDCGPWDDAEVKNVLLDLAQVHLPTSSSALRLSLAAENRLIASLSAAAAAAL